MMRNNSLRDGAAGAPASVEYIISEEDYPANPPTRVHVVPPFPDPAIAPTGVPVVRVEEALIVIFVLVLWVAAIALFFNRWGKIRMLEPYQPKFHQEHRSSCATAVDINHASMAHGQTRMSFSKFNCVDGPNPLFPAVPPTYRSLARPRQNSVFVGSSPIAFNGPPRKTKSAVDIQSLVRGERPAASRSMLPVSASVDRRTSCSTLSARRASGLLGLSPRPCDRRPSSCAEFSRHSCAEFPRHSYCNEFLSPLHCERERDRRRPSFNNVIAQVTAERRPSSSMLRISNV